MDGEFDPESFINGADKQSEDLPTVTVEQPEAKPEALPTISPSIQTYYYPSTPEDTRAKGLSYKMEGGIHGAGEFSDLDLRNHTIEKYRAGESPFVAVAMPGLPTGHEFMTPVDGELVRAKNVDTGGGLKEGQQDIATSNPDLARGGDGSFDPQAFIKRQDLKAPEPSVPDIHAFLEPDTTPEPTPTSAPEETPAEAIGKAVERFGQSIGKPQPIPQFHTPTFQPTPIPQGGAQITPTPPPPIPQPMPTPGTQAQVLPQPYSMAMFSRNVPLVAQQTLNDLKGMVNAPVELSQQALNPRLSIPSRLAAAAGVVASAAQFDPLIPKASREIPGALPEGVNMPPAGRDITVPTNQRPAPQLPEPSQFSVDMPTDQFGTEQTPVSSALIDMGGVVSKSAAQRSGRYKGNEGAFEDATTLAHPTHNKIYNPNGEMPDVAAQTLYDAGLISEPSVQAMRNAVAKESSGARNALKAQRTEAKTIQQGGKLQTQQAKSFISAEHAAWHGGEPAIPVKDLQVGDTVKIGGEQFKVTDIDPDTHDVTLEDGRKFGVQTVQDGTVIYGEHESTSYAPPEATPPPASAPPPATPPRPPPQKPRPAPPKQPASKAPEPLNPVADGGPFRRTFRIDKELGEKMDAIGAAPETGALMSELQHMNMTHELTPKQEADLGTLLVSDRLRGVNPKHPQVVFDSVARGIEADPAIKKALDYYRKEIEPEVEELHKRAGTTEESIAPQRGQYISLIPERLKDGTIPSLVPTASRMSRTTKFARPAEGLAAKYSTNLYDILRETYTESIRKAALRDLYDAAEAKGVAAPSSQFVRDRGNPDPNAGKWVKSVQFTDLPAEIRGDLDLIARHGNTLPPLGAEKILKAYQSTATAIQLGLNPLELQNHMRRALAVAAAKPPLGQGIIARMEWLLPYFGPKIGTLKRAMSEMTPMRQQILKDITEQGGGSTRAMGLHATGMSGPAKKLLFGVPKGKGVMGFDLRLRTVLEEIRRNAEPSMRNDKQRMRQFANGLGQYGTMASWPVRALRNINPYAATTLPMRASELKMLFGDAGFRGETWPKAVLHRAETFMRGTGGTIAMLALGQKLLTGTYPWQNAKGHEFDLKTGVQDKDGHDIYVNNRFISPEFFRAISTLGLPSVLKERGAARPDYVSAAATGPINAAASLVNSPGLSLALAAGPQVALYGVRDPGQHGLDLMKVGRSSRADEARGVPPLLKRAEGVAEQLHPLPASILGYMDEPIKGLKPLGLLSVDKGSSGGGGGYSRSSGRGGSGRSGRRSGR